jgi:hypothetical protein
MKLNVLRSKRREGKGREKREEKRRDEMRNEMRKRRYQNQGK